MPYDYMIDSAKLGETGSAYRTMLSHAIELLQARSPQEIAANASVVFDPDRSEFQVPSLGQTIVISYLTGAASFRGTAQTPSVFWVLAVLHYLAFADGTAPDNDWIPLRMLSGGAVRGGKFDRDSSRTIGSALEGKPAGAVCAACQALGAEMVQTNADISAVFPFLPRYPILLKVWLADEEMPASGQMLVGAQADHYYPSMEDAVSACTLLLEYLQRQLLLPC